MNTVFWTIVAGVSVFVLGQILLKLFIEPILKLKFFKGIIADSLVYYADIYSNPGLNKEEDAKKASQEIRKLGSELMAKITVIPCYRLWSFLRIVPQLDEVRKAHRSLIGLSNGLFRGDPERNTKRVENIKNALCLPKELLR